MPRTVQICKNVVSAIEYIEKAGNLGGQSELLIWTQKRWTTTEQYQLIYKWCKCMSQPMLSCALKTTNTAFYVPWGTGPFAWGIASSYISCVCSVSSTDCVLQHSKCCVRIQSPPVVTGLSSVHYLNAWLAFSGGSLKVHSIIDIVGCFVKREVCSW